MRSVCLAEVGNQKTISHRWHGQWNTSAISGFLMGWLTKPELPPGEWLVIVRKVEADAVALRIFKMLFHQKQAEVEHLQRAFTVDATGLRIDWTHFNNANVRGEVCIASFGVAYRLRHANADGRTSAIRFDDGQFLGDEN
jgi:hypothetical protein